MRPFRRREALALAAGAAATLLAPAARSLARPAPPATVSPLPAGFAWGVASAGFQCEGVAPDSNWRRYVEADPGYDRYGQAVDFYHRYPGDIALAADLGAGVYRISVEWARVQPRPGAWDEAGFAFYDAVIEAIVAAGMRPMLTLDHWVYPGWAAERGGWAHPAMPADWLANASRVVERYAGHDPLWVSFNEPSFYLVNETTNGGLAPAALPVMAAGIIRAHNDIYDHIHRVQPAAMVTSNLAYVAGTVEPVVTGPILDAIAARLDYVGIDYYYGFTPQSILRASPQDLTSLWAMPLQPEGIYYALQHYARRFPGKPLYVVENGMPTRDGDPR
ncbi:family 1 glycosylhydrolase, partial [Nocardia gipuzkoensis]